MIRQDLHIHTRLSLCSGDPLQTPANIVGKARELRLDQICLTDHLWDGSVPGASEWYGRQDLEHIRESLAEMPADTGDVDVFFGCETEYLGGERIGISARTAAELDFILVPISHFHMKGYVRPEGVETPAEIADLWFSRYRELMELDLPWRKIGLAHVTCVCVEGLQRDFLEIALEMPVRELFEKTAERGIAVEINGSSLYAGEAAVLNLELYRMMKECGCLFTLGSDSHGLATLPRIEESVAFAEKLGLGDGDIRILSR